MSRNLRTYKITHYGKGSRICLDRLRQAVRPSTKIALGRAFCGDVSDVQHRWDRRPSHERL